MLERDISLVRSENYAYDLSVGIRVSGLIPARDYADLVKYVCSASPSIE